MKIQSLSQSMIKWKLADVMDLYAIKNKELADALDITASAASNLRTSATMPRIDGHRLNQIISAINEINQSRKNKSKVYPSDLIEWIPDHDAA